MRAGSNITPDTLISIVTITEPTQDMLRETAVTTTNTSFLNDHSVLKVHLSFAVITLLYTPFILITNNLVLWSTILFRKLHTPNNILLASLAIADLIMGIYCIPMYALSYIPSTQHLIKASGKYACLAWFASMELGGASSLKNLLLISADRFIAIVYPLSYSRVITMRTTATALTVLWLYVIAMALVPFFGWNNYNPKIQDQNRRCNYYLTLPEGYVIWASFFTVTISIVIPFILNIKIFYTISKQQQSIKTSAHLWSTQQVKRFKDQVQTVRLTGVLFLLFIMFWLPYVLVAPLKYSNLPPWYIEVIKVIAQLLYFLNSVVNAPIYALMRSEYKVAYYLLLTTAVWNWGSLRRHSLDPDIPRRRQTSISDRRGHVCFINKHSQQQSSVDNSTMPRHNACATTGAAKATNGSVQHLTANAYVCTSPDINLPNGASSTTAMMKNHEEPENTADSSITSSKKMVTCINNSNTELKIAYMDLINIEDTRRPEHTAENTIRTDSLVRAITKTEQRSHININYTTLPIGYSNITTVITNQEASENGAGIDTDIKSMKNSDTGLKVACKYHLNKDDAVTSKTGAENIPVCTGKQIFGTAQNSHAGLQSQLHRQESYTLVDAARKYMKVCSGKVSPMHTLYKCDNINVKVKHNGSVL